MITSTMNIEEVNREIIRVLPDLMRLILSKTKHRKLEARKRGYPDRLSTYNIEGIEFRVCYFFDNDADVQTIFCRYYDVKGVVYAYIMIYEPGVYSIVHFLKHALDQYNARLTLGFDEMNKILLHAAKHNLVMARKDNEANNEEWVDVGWRCSDGLWLGKSKTIMKDSNTRVNIVRTFIDNDLVRKKQEAILDDGTLEKLILFEETIGGDDYARRRVNQLLALFIRKD